LARLSQPIILSRRPFVGFFQIGLEKSFFGQSSEQGVDRAFRNFDPPGNHLDKLITIPVLAVKQSKNTKIEHPFFNLIIHVSPSYAIVLYKDKYSKTVYFNVLHNDKYHNKKERHEFRSLTVMP